MSITEVEAVIVDELQAAGHTTEETLCPCTKFDELGLDSLDKVELVQRVEDRAMNDVPKEVYKQIHSIHDLAVVLGDALEV